MNAPTPPAVLPGPIRQIGFIVTDVDEAIAPWVALGIGPWFVVRGQRLQATYRGAPCEVELTVAFANSGEMQVELIQQHNDAPSIYTEFLESHGPGFHQLAYWTEDLDAAVQAAQKAGWPVVWSGGEGEGSRYAYVEPAGGPAAIIELMELTAATTGLGDFVRAAADGWDGTDPVRTLLGG
jgi:hypothetical protein